MKYTRYSLVYADFYSRRRAGGTAHEGLSAYDGEEPRTTCPRLQGTLRCYRGGEIEWHQAENRGERSEGPLPPWHVGICPIPRHPPLQGRRRGPRGHRGRSRQHLAGMQRLRMRGQGFPQKAVVHVYAMRLLTSRRSLSREEHSPKGDRGQAGSCPRRAGVMRPRSRFFGTRQADCFICRYMT